ncbi:PHP domain-containing protein [Clostridium chauvoei]|uniref:PHP domain-containing protein n=1 Tax=Clostridium chauvoei TaxID=46867 RepID=UPI001C864F97|nr:PHP domain-containing protein [Clostridium chauvoei]MBX7288701.1 PHP domain-containing protein [Clostridium chauvoei]
MYTKGDFHLHTTESDGEHTPTEVVKIAKEKGLDIISITDHNTISGIIEAKKAGEELGIRVIPGLELSTRYNGNKIHILAYFLDDRYENKDFNKGLRYIKNHNIQALEKLMKGNISVFRDNEKNRLDIQTGIEFLKFFGGMIVLAHPIKIKSRVFKEIINLEFDGIEAIYFKNTKEETESFKNLAKVRNIIYTAGSDFHTNNKIDRRHGNIGDVFLNKNEIEIFLNKINSK